MFEQPPPVPSRGSLVDLGEPPLHQYSRYYLSFPVMFFSDDMLGYKGTRPRQSPPPGLSLHAILL